MNVRCAYRAGTPRRVLRYARVVADADAKTSGKVTCMYVLVRSGTRSCRVNAARRDQKAGRRGRRRQTTSASPASQNASWKPVPYRRELATWYAAGPSDRVAVAERIEWLGIGSILGKKSDTMDRVLEAHSLRDARKPVVEKSISWRLEPTRRLELGRHSIPIHRPRNPKKRLPDAFAVNRRYAISPPQRRSHSCSCRLDVVCRLYIRSIPATRQLLALNPSPSPAPAPYQTRPALSPTLHAAAGTHSTQRNPLTNRVIASSPPQTVSPPLRCLSAPTPLRLLEPMTTLPTLSARLGSSRATRGIDRREEQQGQAGL
jgi:hypothetical protein